MVQDDNTIHRDAARLLADAFRAGRLRKKPSPESLSRIAAVIRPVLSKPTSSAKEVRARAAAGTR